MARRSRASQPLTPSPGAPARPRGARGTRPGRRAPTARALLSSLGKHRTLEELAYRDIRRAIVDGTLAPGQRIVVNSVAAAAGISRIPVLQALRRLESEGFVRIKPHKEVVVTTLSPEDFRERFLLMAALERLCLRESAGKIGPAVVARLRAVQAKIVAARAAGSVAKAVAADGEFHKIIWEVSGLREVSQILENLWDRGEYYRAMMHARRGGFAGESISEHEAILGALKEGDLGRAAQALETHRLRAMARLEERP